MKTKYKGFANKGGIYQIKHVKSGKKYIGSTGRFKERYSGHKTSLQNGKHHNSHLQSSFNKYGEESFVFEVLEIIEGDKLKRTLREEEILNEYNISGKWDLLYNIATRTLCTDSIRKSSKEISKKRSEKMKEVWERKGYREKTTKAMRKGWTDEVKAAASRRLSGPGNHLFGKPVLEETKRKISKTSEERWARKKYKEKMSKSISKSMKKQWTDPAVRKKIASQIKKVKSTKEARAKQSQLTKKQWQQTNIRKKMITAQNQPKVKKAKSRAMKQLWKDAYHKEKMAKILKSNAKKQWSDDDTRKKMIKSLQGINSKSYIFITPNGKEKTIINLRKFCESNDLSYISMNRVANGRQKSHKGWFSKRRQ